MTTHTDVSGFIGLFDSIRWSSWRWECQGYYASDEPRLRLWLAGEPSRQDAGDQAWRSYIRGLRRRGVPFERVRMLTEPLTDYLRWMLATTTWNVESGEDIRWITAAAARDVGMPPYDFYLFDDDRLVILRFDDDKNLLGADVTDDAALLAQHRAWRAAVWRLAVPHRDYRAAAGGV